MLNHSLNKFVLPFVYLLFLSRYERARVRDLFHLCFETFLIALFIDINTKQSEANRIMIIISAAVTLAATRLVQCYSSHLQLKSQRESFCSIELDLTDAFIHTLRNVQK